MNQQAVPEIKKDLDCGRQDSAVMDRTRFVFSEPGGVDVVIRWSRDEQRSNNAASCDFWQPEVEARNLGAMTYAELNAALKGA